MTRDNIIGLVLILAILIGSSLLFAPSEEEKQQARRVQDSIATVRAAEQEARQAQLLATETTPTTQTITPEITQLPDTLRDAMLREKLGYFSGAALGEQQTFTLENEVLKLHISNKGGHIESVELKKYKTWDQRPLQLFYGEESSFNLQFYALNRLISTQELYFQPTGSNSGFSIAQNDSSSFALRLYPDNHTETNPSYLEFVYRLQGNDYMIDFQVNTVGMQEVIAANTTFINLDWKVKVPRQEKSRKNEQNVSTIFYKYLNDDVDKLRETRDASENLTTSVKWISFKQQFFSSTLIASNSFSTANIATETLPEDQENYLKNMTASIGIPYASRENNNIPMQFYFGPNHFQTLRAYNLDMERQIPLGWGFFLTAWINRYVVIPVFNYLDGFKLNYGIIILLLTIILKMALFPIAYKTYLSSARMRVLKPDVDAINAKFPKKDDAMKKQQAVMELYKKAGVNPMAGCVPMLLQLPILFALFRFFPASIELRQEAFLWADDLSAYDSILDLPFTIPFYGDHVSLFTLLMTISTVIYTKLNSQMMNTGTQMPGMKTMMYMMPIMFLGIFNNFASGLSYYYFLANVITFGQMFAFRFMINEDKIRHKIEENKKKPVKKSAWSRRLEEMAKQQKEVQRKKK